MPDNQEQKQESRAAIMAKRIAKNKARKAARRRAIKIAKAALLKLKALISTLTGGWMFFLGFIGVIGFLVLFITIYDLVMNIIPATGSNPLNINKPEVEEIGNLSGGIFYTKFSEQSYYVMIDDDEKIYQIGSDEWKAKGDIKDIDNRESQFAISPKALLVLDERLNIDYKNPEQLIKPVYNTCMDSNKDNDSSFCSLLQLTDEKGNVIADSTYYRRRPDDESTKAVNDVVGEVEKEEIYYSADKAIYDKNPNATQKGVWNWGLGSILHYKSFIQDSRISGYRIVNADIWNEKERKIEKVDAFFTDMNMKKYLDEYHFVVPPTTITYDTQEAENAVSSGLSLAVPEDETKYAIDQATTFAGTISNKLEQAYLFQGKSGATSYVNNYFYEYDSSMEEERKDGGERRAYKDSPNIKDVDKNNDEDAFGHIATSNPVKTGFKSVKWEPKEEKTESKPNPNYNENLCKKITNNPTANIGGLTRDQVCNKETNVTVEVHPERYVFDDGTIIDGSKGSLKFTYRYNPKLSYYKEGNLETNTVRYVNSNPDTSKITGIKYLKDYIKNYKAFIPTENSVFKCRDINSAGKTITVNNITECNDSFKVENGNDTKNHNMQSFYFEDMPKKQWLEIAKNINYQLNFDGILDYENDSEKEKDTIEPFDIGMTMHEATEEEIKQAAQNQKLVSDVVKKYGKLFSKYSTEFGVDKALLAAVATQESGGNHDKYIGQDRVNTGFGLMQIEKPTNEREISAYSFSKRREIKQKINVETMSDVELNIKASAMMLQNLLVEFKYNPLIAIQAYNYGSGGINAVLKIYEDQTGIAVDTTILNPQDYGWTFYTKEVHEHPDKYIEGASGGKHGDYMYIKNILKYLPENGTLTFQSAANDASKHSVKTFKINDIYNIAESANNEVMILNQNIASKYRLLVLTNKLKDTWTDIVMGQKDFAAGDYSTKNANESKNISKDGSDSSLIQDNVIKLMPDKAITINYSNTSDEYAEDVIKMMFAYEYGVDYNEFNVQSKEFWEAKFANLFKSVNSKPWQSSIDVNALFGNNISIPVKSYKKLIPYGYYNDEFGIRTYSEKTILQTPPNSEIKALSDGVVLTIDDDGKTSWGKYIEIMHPSKDTNQDDKENKNQEEGKYIVTRYQLLGEISVNQGDEVKAGDVIGKVNKEGEVGLQLLVDNETNNIMDVIDYIKEFQKAYYLLNAIPGYSGPQNEALIPYLEAVLQNADSIEASMTPLNSWELSSFTNTSMCGNRTGGTWAYDGSDVPHPALDWGTCRAIGVPIYAPGDVVLLNSLDNCIDYPNGTGFLTPGNESLAACNGRFGNEISFLYKGPDGNLYATLIVHIMHQSNIQIPDYQNGEFTLKKGTQISSSGNTGLSTGPHEHIEIVNLGKMSLKDAVARFLTSTYDDNWGLGIVPNTAGKCESGMGQMPCKERPDRILNY